MKKIIKKVLFLQLAVFLLFGFVFENKLRASVDKTFMTNFYHGLLTTFSLISDAQDKNASKEYLERKSNTDLSQYKNDLDDFFCKKFMEDVEKLQNYKKTLFLNFLRNTPHNEYCFKVKN